MDRKYYNIVGSLSGVLVGRSACADQVYLDGKIGHFLLGQSCKQDGRVAGWALSHETVLTGGQAIQLVWVYDPEGQDSPHSVAPTSRPR